jgi:hypothetical protein
MAYQAAWVSDITEHFRPCFCVVAVHVPADRCNKAELKVKTPCSTSCMPASVHTAVSHCSFSCDLSLPVAWNSGSRATMPERWVATVRENPALVPGRGKESVSGLLLASLYPPVVLSCAQASTAVKAARASAFAVADLRNNARWDRPSTASRHHQRQ